MSASANTAIVEGMFAAFAGADLPAILETLAADVDWVFEGPAAIAYAGRFNGVDGVVSFLTAMIGTLDRPVFVQESILAEGDKVVNTGRFSGTVKSTGKAFECACVHVLTLRDGKITQFLDFADTAQIAAAYTAG